MNFYFHCVEPGPPEASYYEHGLLALAEGLKEWGHRVQGNRDYWDFGQGPVIEKTVEPPEAFDVVLASNEWFLKEGRLPDGWTASAPYQKVYVDLSDGWTTPACTDPRWPADLILRCHYNSHFRYGPRVKPWAFGLTQRIIEATQGGLRASERPPVVSCNFRVGHPVRDRLTAAFRQAQGDRFHWDDRIDSGEPTDPLARRLWAATGRRHNPGYFSRLKQAQVSLAFGGFFAPGYRSSQTSFTGRMAYHAVQRFRLATSTLTQFDSWRFWESLAAGCRTVHGPLDQWGAVFPRQPEPGEHYWAFGGRGSQEGGDQGRDWALKHYSPRAVAGRLLEWLE